jgi:hypothetical protein
MIFPSAQAILVMRERVCVRAFRRMGRRSLDQSPIYRHARSLIEGKLVFNELVQKRSTNFNSMTLGRLLFRVLLLPLDIQESSAGYYWALRRQVDHAVD